MSFYSLYLYNNDDAELTLISTSSYYGFSKVTDNYNSNCYSTNLESVTNDLIYYIKMSRKRDWLTKILDGKCKHNIFIYEVEIWEKKERHINTQIKKIIPIKKVVPKSQKNTDKLNKYLQLCDQKDMNIEKLCEALYGKELTKESLKVLQNKYLQIAIKDIDSRLNRNLDYDHIYCSSLNVKDDYDDYIFNCSNDKDLRNYYKNLGYRVIGKDNNYDLYFFKRSYIDPLINQLKVDLEGNSDKKYIFEKFSTTNNLTNTVRNYLEDAFFNKNRHYECIFGYDKHQEQFFL